MLLPALRKKGTLVTGPKMGPWGIPHKGTSMDSDNVAVLFRGPGAGPRQYLTMSAGQFEDFTPEVRRLVRETGHEDRHPKVASDMSRYVSEVAQNPFTLEMRKPIRQHPKIHAAKFSAGQQNLPLSHY
jgi:hypothetical protein